MRLVLLIREIIFEFIKHFNLDKDFLGGTEDPAHLKTTFFKDNLTALGLATSQKITIPTNH